jgi:AcrR family transcriptional regulator
MATRDRLIESTRELLWERGYVGTSPRAILDRSGAGQGSLYHHFTGKAELALAAVELSAAELSAAAEQHLAGPGTAVERISGWLNRERDVLRGCPIGRLTADPEVVADPQLGAPVRRSLEWLQRRVAEVLTEGRAAGEPLPDADPAELAAMLVAVLQGGYVLARAANSAEPFHQAVRGALALIASPAIAATGVTAPK